MALKRHHKILIGSFSFFVIVMIILLGFMMYSVYIQETQNYANLKNNISELQVNTQSQLNSITSNLLKLQNNTISSQQQVQQQISLLKQVQQMIFQG